MNYENIFVDFFLLTIEPKRYKELFLRNILDVCFFNSKILDCSYDKLSDNDYRFNVSLFNLNLNVSFKITVTVLNNVIEKGWIILINDKSFNLTLENKNFNELKDYLYTLYTEKYNNKNTYG